VRSTLIQTLPPTLTTDCRGGSGLGLYIAAGIVKLHEGCSLTAASPGEGQGSTFKVVFPVAEAPPVVEFSSSRRGGIAGGYAVSVRHTKLNILVVVRLDCLRG
jgi:hypothetical protein